MPENIDGFNETQSFKEVQKEAKSLSKWFESIAKIKASDPQALAQLDKALKTLPDDTNFVQIYQAFKSKTQGFIDTARSYRANNIKRLISAYIRGQAAERQSYPRVYQGLAERSAGAAIS